MKSLAAFTIAELLVVSLLSVLTASAAIAAFQIVDTQYEDYAQHTEASLRLNSLHALLYGDFAEAEVVRIENNRLAFDYLSYTIWYSFSEDFLVRRTDQEVQRPDTFWLYPRHLEAHFANQPVEWGRIDRCQFEVMMEEIIFPFHFHKSYSAQDLINDRNGD
ncbi:MAG: hypothetical protein AAFP19_04245 [Bacteroidota bacterium]